MNSLGTQAATKPRRQCQAAAPKRRGAPRQAPKTRPCWRETAPHLAEAEQIARRWIAQLVTGEHIFAMLRSDFEEWREAGGVAAVSDVALAGWLREAGLTKYRAGARKITIYSKPAARNTARLAA